MPTTYLDPIDQPTPEQLIAQTLANLAVRIPGWQASGEGVAEVAIAEEFARLASDLTYFAAIREPARVFREFGITVANVPQRAGTGATLTVRLTLAENGQTAPADVVLIGTTTDGIDVEFATDTAATAGASANTVTLTATAVGVGEATNDVPAGPLLLAAGGATVVAATALTPSTGGTDPETDAEYVTRLVGAQSLLKRSVVLGPDAALQARTVEGIHRALGVDNFDANTGQANQERTLSVFVVDDSGGPVTNSAKAALQTLLQSLREVNFVIRVASPTYVAVTVAFTAHAEAGFDPAIVRAAAIARVYALLDPGSWAGGDLDPPQWTGNRTVRYLDLAAEIDRVSGVDFVDSLTINGGTTDVLLGSASTPAVLPASPANGTSVTGTVAAAGT